MNIKQHSDNLPNHYKYSFDLTTFESAEQFHNLIELFGLTEQHTLERESNGTTYKKFCWFKDGLYLATGNNPLTGEYREDGARADETGYASYIAIVSRNKLDLKALARAIGANAEHVKDQGQGFMGITLQQLEELDEEAGFIE